jgi:hypothetical protein
MHHENAPLTWFRNSSIEQQRISRPIETNTLIQFGKMYVAAYNFAAS